MGGINESHARGRSARVCGVASGGNQAKDFVRALQQALAGARPSCSVPTMARTFVLAVIQPSRDDVSASDGFLGGSQFAAEAIEQPARAVGHDPFCASIFEDDEFRARLDSGDLVPDTRLLWHGGPPDHLWAPSQSQTIEGRETGPS